MAEIHVQIKCEGDGFPTAAELATRNQLEDALTAEDVGEVVDAGGGMGVMDLFLEVDDALAAVATAKAIVARLGLSERTTVETQAGEN